MRGSYLFLYVDIYTLSLAAGGQSYNDNYSKGGLVYLATQALNA